MPNHRTHLVTGLTCATVLVYALNQINAHTFQDLWQMPLCIGLALTGSIFPDIDIDSKMQRLFWPIIAIVLFAALVKSKFYLFFILAACTIFVMLIRHRTITHQFWFVISFPFGLAWYLGTTKVQTPFVYVSALFFVVGACSHIFLDRTMSRLKRYK